MINVNHDAHYASVRDQGGFRLFCFSPNVSLSFLVNLVFLSFFYYLDGQPREVL